MQIVGFPMKRLIYYLKDKKKKNEINLEVANVNASDGPMIHYNRKLHVVGLGFRLQ